MGARFSDLQAEQSLLPRKAWNRARISSRAACSSSLFGVEYHAYHAGLWCARAGFAVQATSYDKYHGIRSPGE